MLLRPGSFPCSWSVTCHCTGQCPRNDPSPGSSQLCPWAPLSTAALAPPASPFSFGGHFSKEIWLLLPLCSTKSRCIHLGASHLCTGRESIPLWQAEWEPSRCRACWSLGQPLLFCLVFLLLVPSPSFRWSPATPLALLTLGTLDLNWDLSRSWCF